MLPGFRFLFAAIVLSMSILVFGLGAAALLRAAHEEFASNPSWRAAPEVRFAQPAEATAPVLSMLRVDTPAEEKAPDDAVATTEAAAATEQAAITSLPAESEPVAALKPEEPSPPETAKVESAKADIPVAEGPAPGEAAPAQSEMPASPDETRIATIATGDAKSPADQAVPAPSEPGAAVFPGADIAATKIATLGGPPVSIETRPARTGDPKPGQHALKNRQQARRGTPRRRIAVRARVTAQAPLQPPGPFGQPTPTVRSR